MLMRHLLKRFHQKGMLRLLRRLISIPLLVEDNILEMPSNDLASHGTDLSLESPSDGSFARSSLLSVSPSFTPVSSLEPLKSSPPVKIDMISEMKAVMQTLIEAGGTMIQADLEAHH